MSTGHHPGTSSGRMSFVGVSTQQSSIMRVFPVWAEILGLPTRELVGIDLPLEATPADYIATVTALREDPDNLGALVTTHKMALYAAAHDLFDSLDDFSRACAEISSISKRDGKLIGHAKDPITAGLAVQDAFPDDLFAATGAHALILGAGGAGLALSWYLAERTDLPVRVVVVDTDCSRLAHLEEIHRTRETPTDLITTVPVSAGVVDQVLSDLPAHSLVVNATGMGKDRPGSPLPDGARFPDQANVWDFNYRGSLEFLAQARTQADALAGTPAGDLTIVDGWRYFIHGWTQVIAEVFDIELTPDLVEDLADAAAKVR